MKRVLLVLSILLTLISVRAERALGIYWVDVEERAVTLIMTSEGQSILIHAGIPGSRNY